MTLWISLVWALVTPVCKYLSNKNRHIRLAMSIHIIFHDILYRTEKQMTHVKYTSQNSTVQLSITGTLQFVILLNSQDRL